MEYHNEGYKSINEVAELTGFTRQWIRCLCIQAKNPKEVITTSKIQKVIRKKVKTVLDSEDVVEIKMQKNSVWLIAKSGIKKIKSLSKKGNYKNAKRK